MKTPDDIEHIVRDALLEDVGTGDITAQLIDKNAVAQAQVVVRERAVICGTKWFDSTFHALDERCKVSWQRNDGDWIEENEIACRIEGPARALVTGERTALNFLQTLSATATTTRSYAQLLDGKKTTLLDTRKTIPGLRSAQKFAVSCGGGENHRIGLFDGILIKENHIEAAGSIDSAISTLRTQFPDLPIEIEVESIAELDEALAAGANILLLDNFSNEQIAEAVSRSAGKAKLEASGGYDFASLQAIADIGVDYISVGALTKHIRAIDFSMRFLSSSDTPTN